MRKIIDLKHHFDDYECMWNGIEDIYMDKTEEILPDNYFFVLSGFGTFCYLNTPKGEIKRMVAFGDGRTKKMYEFLAPIVEFDYKHYEYKSFEKAFSKAKAEIDAGYPVVLGALDMFYLPHFEKLYQHEHIPFHYELMVGYDDENKNIIIHDCGRQERIELSYSNLQKAMDCSYPGLSKPNTVCTIRMNTTKGKLEIAKEALSIRKHDFLNPPRGFLGYKGFEKFISELPKLRDEIGKEEYDKLLVHLVEFFGTVPTVPNAIKGINEPDTVKFNGGFDKMSNVLNCLAKDNGDKSWHEAAVFFDNGGDTMQQISDIIIKYLVENDDNTYLLPELFTEVLQDMINGYRAMNI